MRDVGKVQQNSTPEAASGRISIGQNKLDVVSTSHYYIVLTLFGCESGRCKQEHIQTANKKA